MCRGEADRFGGGGREVAEESGLIILEPFRAGPLKAGVSFASPKSSRQEKIGKKNTKEKHAT